MEELWKKEVDFPTNETVLVQANLKNEFLLLYCSDVCHAEPRFSAGRSMHAISAGRILHFAPFPEGIPLGQNERVRFLR